MGLKGGSEGVGEDSKHPYERRGRLIKEFECNYYLLVLNDNYGDRVVGRGRECNH